MVRLCDVRMVCMCVMCVWLTTGLPGGEPPKHAEKIQNKRKGNLLSIFTRYVYEDLDPHPERRTRVRHRKTERLFCLLGSYAGGSFSPTTDALATAGSRGHGQDRETQQATGMKKGSSDCTCTSTPNLVRSSRSQEVCSLRVKMFFLSNIQRLIF